MTRIRPGSRFGSTRQRIAALPLPIRGWVTLSIWMQTTGATLLAAKRCSLARALMPAQDSRSVHGLLYLAAVRHGWRQQKRCQVHLDVGLSAWELDCHASLTGKLQVSHHLRLSVSDRQTPVLTPLSGT